MAGPSSLRSCAFEIPTDDPRFAGFTKTGYFSLLSTSFCNFFGASFDMPSNWLRKTVTCFTMGNPAARNNDFMMSLSMPAEEPSTPAPT